MNSLERRSLIMKCKTKGQIIKGRYIDLYPYTLEHGESIVKIRNQDVSRYNLNQVEILTIEDQNKWYDSYVRRDNDIYWCIYNKAGIMIGVIRVYDILDDGSCCELGSFVIDGSYAMSGPFAIETRILAFDFCFSTILIDKVLNVVRINNKNMNSIARREGFRIIKEFERNGVMFNLYELTENNYKLANILKIFDIWQERGYI